MKVTELQDVDPEEVIAGLFDRATESVSISTTLHPSFFNRPRIRQAFISAYSKVGSFRILLDHNIRWDERKNELPWLAKLAVDSKFDVRESDKPLLHWVIIDSKHFRLEKPHQALEQNGVLRTSNLLIENAIKPVADTLKDLFGLWWKDAIIVK
ncbi:MAG: hypothetical protein A2W22_06130 [Candidatus Levybacteria bacterium RBG_16_35_11]|nr:MAG: hypothetical protein A2W22_06130 [Candidatus Levybacteria bacterium RBG_16_35_11]